MKKLATTILRNPAAKSLVANIVHELATHNFQKAYDVGLDYLAYRIALHITQIETKERINVI